MPDSNNSSQPQKSAKSAEAEQTARDPAVERGERIQSGKEIARSGKAQGQVPGAEPNKK